MGMTLCCCWWMRGLCVCITVLLSRCSGKGLEASDEKLTAQTSPSMAKEGATGLKLLCRYSLHSNESFFKVSWFRLRDDNDPEVIFEKIISEGDSGTNYTFSGSWMRRGAMHDTTSLADVSFASDDVSRDDAGTYRCQLSSDVKRIYSDATFTVIYGPGSSIRITSQQGTFRIKEGETITLVCTASCVPSCHFRWTCSGCMTTRAAMLTIPSIQRDQSGTYTCLAYNRVSRGRADITVDVLYPSFIQQLHFARGGKTTQVEQGQSVSINCQATGNPPPERVTWSVSGQSKDNKTVEMRFGHDISRVFMLSNVSCYDNDVYKCKTVNALGTDVDSVHLKVSCAPTPQDSEACGHPNSSTHVVPLTHTVNLSTCVIARPLPTVSWYRVERDVSTPVLPRVVMYDDVTARLVTWVRVTAKGAEDYGVYRVQIENEKASYGELFSVLAKVQSEQTTSTSASLWLIIGTSLGTILLLLLVVVSLILCWRRCCASFQRPTIEGPHMKHQAPLCIANENVRLSYLENVRLSYLDNSSRRGSGYVDATSTVHDVTDDVTPMRDDHHVGNSGRNDVERNGSWWSRLGRGLEVDNLNRRPSSTSSANIYLDVLGDPSTYINQDTAEDNGSCHLNTQTNAHELHPAHEHPTDRRGRPSTLSVEGYVDMAAAQAAEDDVNLSDDVIHGHDVITLTSADYDDAWCAAQPDADHGVTTFVPSLEHFSDEETSACITQSPQRGVIPTITVQDEMGVRRDCAYHISDVTHASGDDEHVYDVIRDCDVDDYEIK